MSLLFVLLLDFMHIQREELSELSQLLKVTVSQEDCKERVEEKLKQYRRNAKIPGFRQGHVPLSLIRKSYEKAIFSEEIKELLEKSINEYLQKEKLDILGYPLPINEDKINWKDPIIDFKFELGLKPTFVIDFEKIKATHYNIRVEEKEVEEKVNQIRDEHGEYITLDAIKDNSRVYGKITLILEDKQEDSQGNDIAKKNKEYHHTFHLEELSKVNQEKFLQAKLQDTIELDSKDLFKDKEKHQDFIKYQKGDFLFRFRIENAFEIILAPLDEKLFDILFEKGTVKEKETFFEKVKESILERHTRQLDFYLYDIIVEKIIEETSIALPKDFLIRWMKFENAHMSLEQLEADYERGQQEIKRNLIENKLVEEFQLHLTEKEIEENIEKTITSYYKQVNAVTKQGDIENTIELLMKNPKEKEKIIKRVMQDKCLKLFKEKISLEEKTATWEGFMEDITKK